MDVSPVRQGSPIRSDPPVGYPKCSQLLDTSLASNSLHTVISPNASPCVKSKSTGMLQTQSPRRNPRRHPAAPATPKRKNTSSSNLLSTPTMQNFGASPSYPLPSTHPQKNPWPYHEGTVTPETSIPMSPLSSFQPSLSSCAPPPPCNQGFTSTLISSRNSSQSSLSSSHGILKNSPELAARRTPRRGTSSYSPCTRPRCSTPSCNGALLSESSTSVSAMRHLHTESTLPKFPSTVNMASPKMCAKGSPELNYRFNSLASPKDSSAVTMASPRSWTTQQSQVQRFASAPMFGASDTSPLNCIGSPVTQASPRSSSALRLQSPTRFTSAPALWPSHGNQQCTPNLATAQFAAPTSSVSLSQNIFASPTTSARPQLLSSSSSESLTLNNFAFGGSASATLTNLASPRTSSAAQLLSPRGALLPQGNSCLAQVPSPQNIEASPKSTVTRLVSSGSTAPVQVQGFSLDLIPSDSRPNSFVASPLVLVEGGGCLKGTSVKAHREDDNPKTSSSQSSGGNTTWQVLPPVPAQDYAIKTAGSAIELYTALHADDGCRKSQTSPVSTLPSAQTALQPTSSEVLDYNMKKNVVVLNEAKSQRCKADWQVLPTIPAQEYALKTASSARELYAAIHESTDSRTTEVERCLPVKVAPEEVASSLSQMAFCTTPQGLSSFPFSQKPLTQQPLGRAVSPRTLSPRASSPRGQESRRQPVLTPARSINVAPGQCTQSPKTPVADRSINLSPRQGYQSPRQSTPIAARSLNRESTPIAIKPINQLPLQELPRQPISIAATTAALSMNHSPSLTSPRQSTPIAVRPTNFSPRQESPRQSMPIAVSLPGQESPKPPIPIALSGSTILTPRQCSLSPRQSIQSPRQSTPTAGSLTPRQRSLSPRQSTQSPRQSTPTAGNLTPRQCIQSPRQSTQSPRQSTPTAGRSINVTPGLCIPSPSQFTSVAAIPNDLSPRQCIQSPRQSLPVAAPCVATPRSVTLDLRGTMPGVSPWSPGKQILQSDRSSKPRMKHLGRSRRSPKYSAIALNPHTTGKNELTPSRAPSQQGVQLVSLGCACAVKMAFDEIGHRQETLPFDWICTLIEGVIDFLRNDFRGFFDFTNSEHSQVGPTKFTVYRAPTHSWWHDDPTDPRSREKFMRRIQRLRGMQAHSAPILFVRSVATTDEIVVVDTLMQTLLQKFGREAKLLLIIPGQSFAAKGPYLVEGMPSLLVYLDQNAAHSEAVSAGLCWVSGRLSNCRRSESLASIPGLVPAHLGFFGMGGLPAFDNVPDHVPRPPRSGSTLGPPPAAFSAPWISSGSLSDGSDISDTPTILACGV